MPGDLDSLLEGLGPDSAGPDSIEDQRLRRLLRARLLDEALVETRIDRYVVHERLGAGGMGVVFAAHDEQLDRRLAIKLVRRHDTAGPHQDQQRLIREARALARLSHPNVVAIYDVGMHGDRVFIAMELVRGMTLRRWTEASLRSWSETLRCFVQAGEGLAAAHAAGITHRDFKPDNALVGEDGRVRVLDFGLAQGEGAEALGSVPSDGALGSPRLTATGQVAGTPAYMAPEQFDGAPTDARSDQFAFCVALWEALFGERPYPARDAMQLRLALAAGVIATPADAKVAPAWLRAVVERGLAADPQRRWPSMRALLDACQRSGGRRRTWALAGTVVVGGVLTATGGAALWRAHHRAACERDAEALAGVWSPSVAARTRTALVDTGLAHAEPVADRLDGTLGAYVETWREHHVSSCVANVDGELDETAWHRRSDCLGDERERLATLVELLQVPDRALVNNAVRAAYGLPPPDDCEDDARLAANAAAIAATVDRQAVPELRRAFARVELLADTTRPEAVTRATATREQAVALGDPALIAESDLVLGAAHVGQGDYQAAAEATERAYFGAVAVGADQVALMAATELVQLVGGRLTRHDDAQEWMRHAEGLLPRSGAARPWREAALAKSTAFALRELGDYANARPNYERAIALHSELAGADHPTVARAWSDLGGMLTMSNEPDDATRAFDEAERILVAAFGTESLEVARLYSGRSNVALLRGEFVASAELCERVLRIHEALLEPDHPAVASALANLGAARLAVGDPAAARPLLVRAVEIRRDKLGVSHPLVAQALVHLGTVAVHLDDHRAAVEYLGEALEIQRASLPANHHRTTAALVTLGDAHRHLQQFERAIATYDEVIAMDDGVAKHRGIALAGRGMALLYRDEPTRALADFEAALATPIADEPDPALRCELYFGLARALRITAGDSVRAREVSRVGLDHCRAATERGRMFVDRLEAWANGRDGPVP
jgi:tetratricopeptide (TPR) repeat protein